MLIHWLWYAQLPGLDERRKAELLQHFQDPEDLFYGEQKDLEEECGRETAELLQNRDLTEAEDILRSCEDGGIEILTLGDEAYPELLRQIPDPPVVLYVRGKRPDWNRLPLIGAVGTRKASAYGLSMAKKMGYQIARCGGIIVSGAASGIDTMAMRGGLMAGSPVVGVLGCGVDVVYPKSNRDFFEDVLRGGCLISEYPPATEPYRWNFPKRNRIISGLSCGVLVVEAPEKSGALITAHHARDQGRDVFVVTGNAGVDSCLGSNGLLRSGAIYADCGWDVMGEYERQYPQAVRRDSTPYEQAQIQNKFDKPCPKVAQKTAFIQEKTPAQKGKEKKVIDKRTNPPYSDLNSAGISLSEKEQKLLSCLQEECLVDDLIAASGMGTGAVLAALTLLEIKGLVARLPGRRIRRKA